jgi:hypothetical protein
MTIDWDVFATTAPTGPSPAVVALTSLEKAKINFAKYEAEVKAMKATADDFKIIDAETGTKAVEMAGQAKAMKKMIEATRKDIIADASAFVTAVNQFAKPYTAALDGIATVLERKITAHTQEQNRLRLVQQQKIAEEAKKLNDKISKQALKAGVEAPQPMFIPVVDSAPEIIRTAAGSASLRTTWAFEVTDFSQVPDEYKVIDTAAVKNAMSAGIRNIPGIRIFQEVKTQIRSASIPKWDDSEKF